MNSNGSTPYDMVIVGSGISCTAFLLRFLEKRLQANHGGKTVSIAVVEKNNEFWKGIPYGKRSSLNSLTITTLGEFLPPAEKDSFIGWLEGNLDAWTAELKTNAGNTASQWLKNNFSSIQSRSWDDVYLPRYLFGNYVNEKILAVIDKAKKSGIAEVDTLHGEAVDLTRLDDGYKLAVQGAAGKPLSVKAGTVVLAIGSPPVKSLLPLGGTHACEYMDDPYTPSIELNLEKIQSLLSAIKEPSERNVLVVGSNASSLELVYLIETTPALRAQLNNLTILSYSGKLPYPIGPINNTDHRLEHISKLSSAGSFTATKLIATFEKDVEIAERQGMNIADICPMLNTLVVELIKKMPEPEQKYFYGHFGQRFAKLVRRAGAEYRTAADNLKRDGKLTMLKGSFRRLEASGVKGNGVKLVYATNGTSEEAVCPLEFPLVINCGGSEELDDSSSPLIKGLVAKGLCVVNATKKGVEVTEDFEAVNRLYVTGPLLGGVFNNRVRLWHVENAKSIFRLGDLLADTVSRHL